MCVIIHIVLQAPFNESLEWWAWAQGGLRTRERGQTQAQVKERGGGLQGKCKEWRAEAWDNTNSTIWLVNCVHKGGECK